jgi:hypothetical protein
MDVYRVSRRGQRSNRSAKRGKRSDRRRTKRRTSKRVSRRDRRVSRRRNVKRVSRRRNTRRVNRRTKRNRRSRSNRRSRRVRRVRRVGSVGRVGRSRRVMRGGSPRTHGSSSADGVDADPAVIRAREETAMMVAGQRGRGAAAAAAAAAAADVSSSSRLQRLDLGSGVRGNYTLCGKSVSQVCANYTNPRKTTNILTTEDTLCTGCTTKKTNLQKAVDDDRVWECQAVGRHLEGQQQYETCYQSYGTVNYNSATKCSKCDTVVGTWICRCGINQNPGVDKCDICSGSNTQPQAHRDYTRPRLPAHEPGREGFGGG